MDTAKDEQRRAPTDQSPEHIRLRIPLVALGTQELVRALTEKNGGGPFDQLVQGADRQDDADDEKREHPCPANEPPSKQDLPGDQRRNQALEEVTDLVVGIATELQEVGKPEAKGYPGVCVCPTEHEYDGMGEDQAVEQAGQRKATVGRQEDGHRDDHRKHLQRPGGAVKRVQAGHHQQPRQGGGG